jgi:hypothetical protein
MNNIFDADGWIKRAGRGFAAIMCILALRELIARTPFGPLLLGCLAIYAAYRIWAIFPQRPRRSQRNTGGAERTPVLPGGHQ